MEPLKLSDEDWPHVEFIAVSHGSERWRIYEDHGKYLINDFFGDRGAFLSTYLMPDGTLLTGAAMSQERWNEAHYDTFETAFHNATKSKGSSVETLEFDG